MQQLYDKCKSCRKVSRDLGVSRSTVQRYVKTESIEKISSEERKKRNVTAVQRRRKQVKEMAVEYKGGKCQCCGYDKYSGALEFHHKYPNEKEFSIGFRGYCYAWEKVKKELDKCVLVCANCHREIHAGLIKI